MKVKAGASVQGLHISMRKALKVADMVWRNHGEELVITEGMANGGHSAASLHYFGRAIDCRTRYFDRETKQKVHAKVKVQLGKDYDVVIEVSHIHIEYDPKG